MPNYVLSRTSPPAHIYERKINLGYGLKVDTSDANPKERKMNEQILDVADEQPVVVDPGFADGTVLVQDDNDYPTADILETEKAEGKEIGEINDFI